MAKFKKGQPSANPLGRPKGSGKKFLIGMALDAISKERQMDVRKEMIETLVDASLDGDMTATKILMERLETAYKPISIPLDLDKLPDDPVDKSTIVINVITDGTIPTDIGHQLIATITNTLRISESSQILQRLEAIEKKIGLT